MNSVVIAAARKQSEKLRIPLANVLACIAVESNGVIFAQVNGRAEPLIRFEGHYFDKRVKPSKRDLARKLGLAAAKMGVVKNPANQQDRWDKLLTPALRMDQTAAIESTSWGVGQVMGSHWNRLDYLGPVELMSAAREGAEGQVDLMFRYIKEFGLVDELQRGDFTGFARGYNGPAYKKFKYDTKMAAKAKEFAKTYGGIAIRGDETPAINPATAALARTYLRMGTEGAKVREAQNLLRRAGYVVDPDGDFGPATRDAVKAFQQSKGLKDDGKIGPNTWRALDEYRTAPDELPGQLTVAKAAVETPEGRSGAAVAGSGLTIAAAKEAIEQAIETMAPSVGVSPIVDTFYACLTGVGAVLTIGGLAYLIYGWVRSRQTRGVEVAA